MEAAEQVSNGNAEIGRSSDRLAEVAQEIFRAWIATDPMASFASHLSATIQDAYRAKWRLYREATVIWTLLPQHEHQELYSGILRELERLIFPPQPDAEGMAKLSKLDAARKDFADLLDRVNTGKGTELSWARAWFADIGRETNPVELTMFVSGYLDFWQKVVKTLDHLVALAKRDANTSGTFADAGSTERATP